MEFKIPSFKTDKELLDFIVENKEDILYSKKQTYKKADGFSSNVVIAKSFGVSKSAIQNKDDDIDAVLIINTTNLLDSHNDVHIKGLWDKSISENKKIKHLQEHQMSFDKIIADKDDLKVYTKEYTWKQLGYDAKGKTEALVFESKIKKDRNPFMHKQYLENNVDNHSVGMRYMKLVLCINNEDYGAEFEAWEKYAPSVANTADLERTKYFWAVTEAKAIEGSAVPIGSNPITPTYSSSVKEKTVKNKSSSAIDWLKS